MGSNNIERFNSNRYASAAAAFARQQCAATLRQAVAALLRS
jgi:hypothetical protein